MKTGKGLSFYQRAQLRYPNSAALIAAVPMLAELQEKNHYTDPKACLEAYIILEYAAKLGVKVRTDASLTQNRMQPKIEDCLRSPLSGGKNAEKKSEKGDISQGCKTSLTSSKTIKNKNNSNQARDHRCGDLRGDIPKVKAFFLIQIC